MTAPLAVPVAVSKASLVKEGLFHGLLSVLPTIVGLVALGLSQPAVIPALESAWPAFPVSACVGAFVALLSWWKNRNGK